MPYWRVTEPNTSLFIGDKPLAYQNSHGEEIAFVLQHKGKPGLNGAVDVAQPAIFTVGTNWHTGWRSYMQYVGVGDPSLSGSERFLIFLGDGSARQYNSYAVELSSKALLVSTNGGYRLTFPDGSRNVYESKVTLGGNDYWFMSRQENAAENATAFSYAFTTDSGGVTNSVRLDTVTDVDGLETTFVYTNNAYYSNILIQVNGPFGLTAKLGHDGQTRITNLTDAINLSSSFQYDSSNRVSTLTTPYGTNSFTYYNGGSGWTALRIDELGIRQHLHLEGYNPANVLSTALSESDALHSFLTANSLASTVQTNYFEERNTFYWGPRQYANLPSGIRTALTNSTFDPANLSTNDYKLGWTRHWLRSRNTNVVLLSSSLSVERAPSPDTTGVTEGLLTWYDYKGKSGIHTEVPTEYEGTQRMPRLVAYRAPGGDWRATYTERQQNGLATLQIDNYGPPGSIAWRTSQYEYAANQIDLTRITENGVVTATNVFNDYHQITNAYNALEEVTSYTYDGNRQLSTVTSPNGLVTTRTYGANGFLLTSIDSDGVNNLRTNSYTYTNGLALTHTDERGLSITNTWDELGRLTKTASREGAVTHAYNKLDRVTTIDRMGFTNGYAYNGFRELLRQTNANGAVSTYTYCDCGSLDSITDALGNVTSYSYDNLGQRTRTTFPGGSYVDSTFDLLGNVTRTADNAGVGMTNFYTINRLAYAASNTFGRVFLRAYDEHDRVVGSTDQNGVSQGFLHDVLGRMLVHTNRTEIDTWNDELHVWATRFDYTNNVAAAVATYREEVVAYLWSDPEGALYFDRYPFGPRTTFEHDPFTRKTNEIHWDATGLAVMTNAFVYSAAGDLLNLSDGKRQMTTWKYDDHGRVTNKLDAAGTVVFRYGYDANGRLSHRWTPEKGYTYYSYDALGNLTTINYPASPDITLAYDKLNRLTNMVDAVGATGYGYTAFGALQGEDGPWADDAVMYSYTANRLRSGLSLAQASGPAWSQSYAYDAANRLSTLTSPAGTFGYTYGSVGTDSTPSQLIRKLTLPNGSAITNQFDEQGRQLGTTLRNSGGTLLNQHLYDYNDLDQRTKQTRVVGTSSTSSVDYGYDALGQLVDATGRENGGTTNRVHEQFGYAYDAAGNLNRRTNNALVQSFTVNNLNQLSNATRSGTLTVAGATTTNASSVTVNTLTADRYADNTFARAGFTLSNGTNTFTAIATDSLGRGDTNTLNSYLPSTLNFVYDLNGNLRTNGTRVLEYDDENQLTRVTEPSAWKAEFTYDGKLRMRISKDYAWRNGAWVLTNEVHRVYNGMLVLQERDQFNVPKLTYTRGKDLSGSLEGAGGIGGLLALSEMSNLSPSIHSYYHSDGNGNVTAMVDTNQNVVARYLYDPFGNTLSATGPKAEINKYRFSSKEWHAPSGMVYYGYRWYIPELQRWGNRDPIGERGGLNLYGIVANRTINKVDALGLDDADYGPWAWNAPKKDPKPPEKCKYKVCFGPMSKEEADGWTRYYASNEDAGEACISGAVGAGCMRLGVPSVPSLGIGIGLDLFMSGYDGPIFHPGDVLCFESETRSNPYTDSGVDVLSAGATINGVSTTR